jgi:formate hydrogenlyase transcriptional activator
MFERHRDLNASGAVRHLHATSPATHDAAAPHTAGRRVSEHGVASLSEVIEQLRHETIQSGPTRSQPSLQRLTTELAARFVTIEPEAIDDTIVDSLRQVAEAMQLDRAILWREFSDVDTAPCSHSWTRQPYSSLADPSLLAGIPFFASKLDAGESAWFARTEDIADDGDREAIGKHGFRSAAMIPMVWADAAGKARGAVVFGSTTEERDWTDISLEFLRLAAAVLGQALARQAGMNALRDAIAEMQQLRQHLTEQAVQDHPNVRVLQPSSVRDQLRAENLYLRREVQERQGTDVIVGESAAIRRVLEQGRQVAATDSTVLLLGETGTGKELIAEEIHRLSARRGRVMVRVNCAAIPNTLMESELFGREKGAFTGALVRQIGRFELADRSTIFLDEIGDLPPEVQVKLLRVLEERQIERLGSPKPVHVDVRIIAATHRNLEQRIEEDEFREDLFYRLNVFPIQVPPLRDRVEDIPLLVWRFVDEFSKSFGKRIDAIAKENMAALKQYPWPGNIRELRNVVERAMIVATGRQLTITLPRVSGPAPKTSLRMTDVEKEHVRSVLESSGWRIRGVGGAAERLGLRPTTLETRMAKLGLSRPKPA